MLSGARILVTGGAGFVGTHLLRALAEQAPDAQLTVLKRDERDRTAHYSAVADIADADAIDAVVARLRPDVVLHLAAQASVGGSAEAGEATWRVNFTGSWNLSRAVGRHVPDATFINVSTGEAYGRSFLAGVADEDTPLQPTSPYARSKAAAELMLGDVLPETTRLITLRPFNHTGPGQDERFVVPSFAAQIARLERDDGDAPMQVGNLDARRDFLDVRDVVDAYCRVLARLDTLPMRNCFNIASGTARPIQDILDILLAQARRRIAVDRDPARMRPSEIDIAVGSAQRLSDATGWALRIPIEQTLAGVLAYERSRLETDLPHAAEMPDTSDRADTV